MFRKQIYFKLVRDLSISFDRDKSRQLYGYQILLQNDIFWRSRDEYFQILNLYLNKQINIDEFIHLFSAIQSLNFKIYNLYEENLKLEAFSNSIGSDEDDAQLYPDLRSDGFMNTVVNVISDSIEEFRYEDDPLSEQDLHDILFNYCFIELSRYCNKS